MKYLLLILILIVVAGALLYRRLKPYISLARQVRAALRDGGQLPPNRRSPFDVFAPPTSEKQAEKLVRCETCKTMMPLSRTVRGRFCSNECETESNRNAS